MVKKEEVGTKGRGAAREVLANGAQARARIEKKAAHSSLKCKAKRQSDEREREKEIEEKDTERCIDDHSPRVHVCMSKS